MLNKKRMETALRRYNDLMELIGHEHCTIGTRLSEGTEGWNLRDMVAEVDYTLSCYYEVGHIFEEMRHDPEGRPTWLSETGKLRRFIKAYEPYIADMACADGHCSKYDN